MRSSVLVPFWCFWSLQKRRTGFGSPSPWYLPAIPCCEFHFPICTSTRLVITFHYISLHFIDSIVYKCQQSTSRWNWSIIVWLWLSLIVAFHSGLQASLPGIGWWLTCPPEAWVWDPRQLCAWSWQPRGRSHHGNDPEASGWPTHLLVAIHAGRGNPVLGCTHPSRRMYKFSPHCACNRVSSLPSAAA